MDFVNDRRSLQRRPYQDRTFFGEPRLDLGRIDGIRVGAFRCSQRSVPRRPVGRLESKRRVWPPRQRPDFSHDSRVSTGQCRDEVRRSFRASSFPPSREGEGGKGAIPSLQKLVPMEIL